MGHIVMSMDLKRSSRDDALRDYGRGEDVSGFFVPADTHVVLEREQADTLHAAARVILNHGKAWRLLDVEGDKYSRLVDASLALQPESEGET